MQASLFYSTNYENSIPLILLKKDQWKNDTSLSSFELKFLNAQQFTGKLGEVALLHSQEGGIEKAFVGSMEGQDNLAVAHALNRLPKGTYSTAQLSKSALLAWSLAQYRFDKYKNIEIKPRLLAVTPEKLEDVLKEADAIFLIRDLINTPASDLGPKELGEVVAHLAKKFNAEFEEWVGEDLLKNNFPAIHAVGRAASAAPRLLSLTWGDRTHPKITLVGKGVCFDSGGLDIKQPAGMRLMKKDMGGAAQVIGLAAILMAKKLPIHLQVLIPAVENAISNDSYRPGDILTMRNGLRVEIENTDAEGRLVLADALVKACEENPELIIDFATLTTSARVSVGTEISAMFSNDDKLAQDVTLAGNEAGDPVWRMPLYKPYESLLDSSIADLTNSSTSPYAGAILAGLFLQRFVKEGIPWVHFDIMAWNLVNKPGKPEGGEAMAVLAMTNYLSHRYG
ncbi:leucyl aminopeptidase (plasmid) [Legionella adelaidensis]|uniref:Aminopeptidase n=1 Tax=Legionella adelaidensis TaxID=45056 RepID=A0A0W0R2W7_9GAMM|nr:leucyl aminopeptidase family protein [Legionella adelaidensis]KTC65416.1 aminopeptidase [Legionella adelaidensis]VEH84762.1 leucyl aminopeptidase [Legionella adelaidensis]